MRHGQAEHQGAQQLGLARAGRADDQAVRAHALLGRLLDVEVDRRAGRSDADRHPELVAGRTSPPRVVDVIAAYVADADQVGEVWRAGEGVLAYRSIDNAQRSEPAGAGLGRRRVHLVCRAADRLFAHPQCGDHGLAVVARLLLDHEAQSRGVGELVPAVRQVEHRDSMHTLVGHEVVAGWETPAIDDEQDVGRGQGLVSTETGTIHDVCREHRRQIVDRGRDQPAGTDRIVLARALRLREPLEPLPMRRAVVVAQDSHDQLVRRVERGRGAHHRAGQAASRVGEADDLDAAEGREVDRGREVGLHAVHRQQAMQGGGSDRVELFDRGAFWRHQLERQGLGRRAVADVEVTLVVGRTLPDPRAVLRQGRQRRRIRVRPAETVALLLGRLPDGPANPGEVLQVLAASATDLQRALLALPVDADPDEAQGGDQEHAGGDEASPAVRSRGGDEDDRTDTCQHRQRHHESATGTLVGLQLRRRLEDHLPRRHDRRLDALATSKCGDHSTPCASSVGMTHCHQSASAPRL